MLSHPTKLDLIVGLGPLFQLWATSMSPSKTAALTSTLNVIQRFLPNTSHSPIHSIEEYARGDYVDSIG